MAQQELIQLFENLKIRVIWDDEQEKYFFSVVDVVRVLLENDYQTARKYWKVLKGRLQQEGFESVTNCYQLKMTSPLDGKKYLTDVADKEQLFRIIQSVPSKKAEPVKQWLAKVGAERINQMQDPERGIRMSLQDYKRLGRSDNWINQRLKSIEVRKNLTDQWQAHGVEGEQQYAALTDIIYQAWSGLNTREYKQYKGLHQENLRDNMTNEELVINMLAELATTNIEKQENPQTMPEHKIAAARGGDVARVARTAFEQQTGQKVVSSLNAKDQIEAAQPSLPFEKENKEK